MTLDPETFARLAPADRLMRCAFDNVCAAVRRAVWESLAVSGDADRRGPGVEPQRAARGPCHRVRARRRRRALTRPRRALRAGAHLGPASAAAPAVRPSLGAHSGRAGAAASSRRCGRIGSWSPPTGVPTGSAQWRRAMGLGVAWPLGQFLGGWTAAERAARTGGREACDARAPDRARLSAARARRRGAVRRVGRDARLPRGSATPSPCSRAKLSPDAPEFRVRQEASATAWTLFWINNTFRTTRRFEDTYVNPHITARAAAGHRRGPPGRRARPSPDVPVDDDRRRAGPPRHPRRADAARLLADLPPRPVARPHADALRRSGRGRMRALHRRRGQRADGVCRAHGCCG